MFVDGNKDLLRGLKSRDRTNPTTLGDVRGYAQSARRVSAGMGNDPAGVGRGDIRDAVAARNGTGTKQFTARNNSFSFFACFTRISHFNNLPTRTVSRSRTPSEFRGGCRRRARGGDVQS